MIALYLYVERLKRSSGPHPRTRVGHGIKMQAAMDPIRLYELALCQHRIFIHHLPGRFFLTCFFLKEPEPGIMESRILDCGRWCNLDTTRVPLCFPRFPQTPRVHPVPSRRRCTDLSNRIVRWRAVALPQLTVSKSQTRISWRARYCRLGPIQNGHKGHTVTIDEEHGDAFLRFTPPWIKPDVFHNRWP